MKTKRKLHLTEDSVRKLQPEPKRLAYFDTKESKFCVRVSPSGFKAFSVHYTFKGRPVQYTIGPWGPGGWTVERARKEAQDAKRDAVQNGINRAAKKKQDRQAETFEEIATEYISRHAKPHKKSWPEDQRIINSYLLPKFRSWKANQIGRADIRPVLEKLALNSKVMANRVLACTRMIFKWAISVDLLENNPCADLPKPGGKESSRDRVLSEEELKELWQAFEAEQSIAGDIFKLRLLTAQRGLEVRGLKWEELDLDSRWWTIPRERAKNKQSHRVWLGSTTVLIVSTSTLVGSCAQLFHSACDRWVFRGFHEIVPLEAESLPALPGPRALAGRTQGSGNLHARERLGHFERRLAPELQKVRIQGIVSSGRLRPFLASASPYSGKLKESGAIRGIAEFSDGGEGLGINYATSISSASDVGPGTSTPASRKPSM